MPRRSHGPAREGEGHSSAERPHGFPDAMARRLGRDTPAIARSSGETRTAGRPGAERSSRSREPRAPSGVRQDRPGAHLGPRKRRAVPHQLSPSADSAASLSNRFSTLETGPRFASKVFSKTFEPFL